MFGISTFRDSPFWYNCFYLSWLFPKNLHKNTWLVSRLPALCCYCASHSQLSQLTSLSKGDYFLAIWNDSLRQKFNVFSSCRRVFIWLHVHFHDLFVLWYHLFLLMIFHKFLWTIEEEFCANKCTVTLEMAVLVDIKNEHRECTVFMRFISFSELTECIAWSSNNKLVFVMEKI